MRVLCASVLVFEAVVVGLAVPVALATSDVPGARVGAAGGLLALLCLLAAGAVGRRGGVAAGWVLQGLVVATGLVVPLMFALGAVFAGLWWAAVHYGRRAEELRAGRAAGGGAG